MLFDRVKDTDGVEMLVNLDTVRAIRPGKYTDALGNRVVGSVLIFLDGEELSVTRTVDRFWSEMNSL